MLHSEFQQAVIRTMPSLSPDQLPNWALGLCGETAEVVADMKAKTALTNEVGDQLWYCHAILACLRVDADDLLFSVVPQPPDLFAACRIAELVKKHMFHFKPLKKDLLLQEIRAVVGGAMTLLGDVPLTECYRQNVAKLLQRYPDGFPI